MSRRSWAPPPRKVFQVPGFVGMHSQRGGAYLPGEMDVIYNMIPESRDRPGRLLLRQGFLRFTTGSTAARPDPAPGNNRPQYQEVRFNSTMNLFFISQAGVFKIDIFAKTATLQLSPAQIVAAGAAINTFQSALQFNGKLVVINYGTKPWMWDGTPGGGITVLAAAPTSPGGATVHAGKLFFHDGKTLYWSNELDATTGYSGTQTWDLTVTSDNIIFYILGTNAGLMVFRQNNGIQIIRGEVNENFQATATRDAVTGVGSASISEGFRNWGQPVFGYRDAVLFWDQSGRPCIYRDPGSLSYVWQNAPTAFVYGLMGPDSAPFAFSSPGEFRVPSGYLEMQPIAAWYDIDWHVHTFAVLDQNSGYMNLLNFDAESDKLVSIWRVSAGFSSMIAKHQDTAVNTGYANVTMLADGSGYLFFQPNLIIDPVAGAVAQQWNDETFNSTGAAVPGVVIGPPHGWDIGQELQFLRADVIVDAIPGTSAPVTAFEYVTSLGHKASMNNGSTFSATNPATTPYERRIEFGFSAAGRWLRPKITVAGSGDSASSRPGLFGYRIEAAVLPSSLGGY